VELRAARERLARAVDQGDVPGAVALVAQGDRVLAHWALGRAQVEPESRPMRPDTIFDLASLTKVVAGTSVVLRLIEERVWALDDPVMRFLPAFATGAKRAVTLRHLVTHTSGLASWAPVYAYARDRPAVLRWLGQQELVAAPGTVVCYSDLGYMLVGLLAELATGEPFDRLAARAVIEPLGLADTCYRPPARLRSRIAATERGDRCEQAMTRDAGAHFDGWRQEVAVGSVNDGNAHYALDGVSSHAGLFSTALDLLRVARVYLGAGRLFRPETVRAALTDGTGGLTPPYGVGWALGPAFAAGFSARSFGHTGFTGTALAVDPERELVVALLMNSTHPEVRSGTIQTLRTEFFSALASTPGAAGAGRPQQPSVDAPRSVSPPAGA
jgi:serine-type D-Ala-D-Ala carboxypeptidase